MLSRLLKVKYFKNCPQDLKTKICKMKQNSLNLIELIILWFLARIIAFSGSLCPKNGTNFDEQKNTKEKFQRQKP